MSALPPSYPLITTQTAAAPLPTVPALSAAIQHPTHSPALDIVCFLGYRIQQASSSAARTTSSLCQLSCSCHRQQLPLHAVEATGLRETFAASGMYLEFITVLDDHKHGELVILDEEVRLELIIGIEAIR